MTRPDDTPQLLGDQRTGPVAAGQTIFAGAIVMLDSTGHLRRGTPAPGLVGVGVAEQRADNRRGANGDLRLTYLRGRFRFNMGADRITAADIGSPCFAIDDQTVARTSDDGRLSPAGLIDDIEGDAVWVRFDPALARAAGSPAAPDVPDAFAIQTAPGALTILSMPIPAMPVWQAGQGTITLIGEN